MAYTVEVNTSFRVVDSNGLEVTSPIGGITRRISCAGEEIFRATATVIDSYGKVTLWNDGDGGVGDFDAMVFISDQDVLLETVEDRAVTPLYSTYNILANIPFVLSSDDTMNVATADTSQSTTDTIDQISVQRNAANGTDDATVTLVLVT